MQSEFDLNPDPRILPMLGEINLSQERCLAELIDNSVDGFLKAKRDAALTYRPEVSVSLPSTQSDSARITVADNGPGMSPDVLETAVKAGWTNNDPIRNLGLFGMGFNIATARIGRLTTVWTTRSGDKDRVGLTIDFDRLINEKTFKTPVLVVPKANHSESGTIIEISKLKHDQFGWFSKGSNVAKLKAFLSRIYSSMLRSDGKPLSFSLIVNGEGLTQKRHCVWSEERFTQVNSVGAVHALMTIDASGSDRPFCTRCWVWLHANGKECPQCKGPDRIENRKRRITGWIGLQRYLDESDYGLDLIRNGRKIEIGNKDLFYFDHAGVLEKEYPIDDPRDRGRFIGEIHMDHCRVSYTKDKFDRDDPAWQEMVHAIKGRGPLRPELAKELGIGGQTEPLFKLFQAFRRSTPKPKVSGCWKRLLVLPENTKALEFARRFDAGDPAYQSDAEWYKVIQQEDDALQETPPDPNKPDKPPGPHQPTDPLDDPTDGESPTPGPDVPPKPARREATTLSGDYTDDVGHRTYKVMAYYVTSDAMPNGRSDEPLCFQRLASGVFEFLINIESSQYDSITFSPRSALIVSLAHVSSEQNRSETGDADFIKIHTGMRKKYCSDESLQLNDVLARARHEIDSVLSHLKTLITPERAREIFAGLGEYERTHVIVGMADKQTEEDVIGSRRFLDYAPSTLLVRLVRENAANFFNGRYWLPTVGPDDSLNSTPELKDRILRRHLGFLEDAFWARSASLSDYESAEREYKIRVAMSISLMTKIA